MPKQCPSSICLELKSQLTALFNRTVHNKYTLCSTRASMFFCRQVQLYGHKVVYVQPTPNLALELKNKKFY